MSKPLPWPTYPVVHPLTQLPCGCLIPRDCRVVDGLGRKIPEVVEFNVITKVATCNTKTDEGRPTFTRDAYGGVSIARHTTHGARLFCAHGEVRAVDDADDEAEDLTAKHERARHEMELLLAERDSAIAGREANAKELESLRARMEDARRERTSVTSQVRAVDEEPKAAPAVVKADAWPLLHGVFERLQAAENSARKGDTTSALLRVISAVRDLACVEQGPGGGK